MHDELAAMRVAYREPGISIPPPLFISFRLRTLLVLMMLPNTETDHIAQCHAMRWFFSFPELAATGGDLEQEAS
jgi:hypothetical protein